jgi:hypothetical protein
MTNGLAYCLRSQTGTILEHLGKFRKILLPPRCAFAVVERPIVAPDRRL